MTSILPLQTSVQNILDVPPRQRNLSSMIEDHQLKLLFDLPSSPAQQACLLSVSSLHASAWLSVTPTPQLNLHLEPPEFLAALKWWLRMGTSKNTSCSLCHHALTLCIRGQLEVGSSLDEEGRQIRPADILVQNWGIGKLATLDFTIASPLNPTTLNEVSVTAGSAAWAAEARKHATNDVKCNFLGRVCIPLAVETYGC